MAMPAFPAGWRIARDSLPVAAVVAMALAGAGGAAGQVTTYIGSGGGSGVIVDPAALDRLGPRRAPGPDVLILPLVIEGGATLVPPAAETPPLPSWPTYAEQAPVPPPPPPPEPVVAALPQPPAEPVPAQPLPGAEPPPQPVAAAAPEPVAGSQATVEPEPPAEPEPEPQAAATALASAPAGVPDLTRPGPLFSIGFAAEESELRPEAASSLEGLVAAMAADATARVQLVAYAGASAAGASAARRLSLSRALAVRAFLIERGIRSTRIDVRALGAKSDGGPPDRVDIVALPR